MLKMLPDANNEATKIEKKAVSQTEDLKLILYDDIEGIALLRDEHYNKINKTHLQKYLGTNQPDEKPHSLNQDDEVISQDKKTMQSDLIETKSKNASLHVNATKILDESESGYVKDQYLSLNLDSKLVPAVLEGFFNIIIG